MKKYIKILGLATIIILQSCEISERDMHSENPQEISKKILKEKDVLETTKKDGSSNKNSQNTDTGDDDDDDEPRRDKSHWRIVQDTIQ